MATHDKSKDSGKHRIWKRLFKSKETNVQDERDESTGEINGTTSASSISIKLKESNASPGPVPVSVPAPPLSLVNKNDDLSLWDKAYDAVQKKDPKLIQRYEEILDREVLSKSVPNSNRQTESSKLQPEGLFDPTQRQSQLDEMMHAGAKKQETKGQIYIAGHAISIRNQLEMIPKVVDFAKIWIDDAVKASPEASVAWSIICLTLPLLLKPAEAERANSSGFVYVTARMRCYIAMENLLWPENLTTTSTLQQEHLASSLTDLYQCIVEFQISSIIRSYRNSFKTFADDVLGKNDWDAMHKYIQGLEASIHKDILNFSSIDAKNLMANLVEQAEKDSLTLNTIHGTLQAQLELSKEQKDIATDTLKALNSINKLELSRDQQKCIYALYSESSYRDVMEQTMDRIDGTCEWFLSQDAYKTWIAASTGSLLVSADPGCGKSVLAKYLIKHELPRVCKDTTICYYFFKDKVGDRLTPALCALLHQLVSVDRVALEYAVRQFQKDGPKMVESAETLFDIFYKAATDKKMEPVVVVLDALDECEKTDLLRLFRLLERLQTHMNAPDLKVRFLFTSRGYDQIISSYENDSNLFQLHIPGEMHSGAIGHEVDLVVKYRIQRLCQKKRLDDELRLRLEAKISSNSQRTYLWVHVIFYELERVLKKTAKELDTFLEKVPGDIDQLYQRMLSRFSDSPEVQQRVYQILCAMLVAKLPLMVAEIQCLAKLELCPASKLHDDLDLQEESEFAIRMREWCGLFIQVYNGKVAFLHQTARTFLLNSTTLIDPSARPPLFWHGSIGLVQAHMVIAQACITYLSLSDFAVMPKLLPLWGQESEGDESIQGEESSEEEEKNEESSVGSQDEQGVNETSPNQGSALSDHSDTLANYPLLLYAAKNWIYHFHMGSCTHVTSLSKDALNLFDTSTSNFETWKRATGLDYYFSDHEPGPIVLAAAFPSKSLLDALLTSSDLWNNVREREIALLATISFTEFENAICLLDFHVDPNCIGYLGATPLIMAAIDGHTIIVKMLLSYRADVNIQDQFGGTALMEAARTGHTKLVKMLLSYRADVNIQDQSGRTALMKAAWKRHTIIVEMLLSYRADVNIQDDSGRTALIWATVRSHPTIVEKLLEKKADVNIQDDSGRTALIWAAWHGHTTVVEMLLDAGADATIQDHSCATAHCIASRGGHKAIIPLLPAKPVSKRTSMSDLWPVKPSWDRKWYRYEKGVFNRERRRPYEHSWEYPRRNSLGDLEKLKRDGKPAEFLASSQ